MRSKSLSELRRQQGVIEKEYSQLASFILDYMRAINRHKIKIGKYVIEEIYDWADCWQYMEIEYKRYVLLKHYISYTEVNFNRLEDLIVFKSIVTEYIEENSGKALEKYEKAEEFKKIWRETNE